METLEITFYCIGLTTAVVAGFLKVYKFAYSSGYADGNHCGFTRGLYAAAERENRRNKGREMIYD